MQASRGASEAHALGARICTFRITPPARSRSGATARSLLAAGAGEWAAVARGGRGGGDSGVGGGDGGEGGGDDGGEGDGRKGGGGEGVGGEGGCGSVVFSGLHSRWQRWHMGGRRWR